jgi:23S rRNA pseudouridine955/2504/2580 synthase
MISFISPKDGKLTKITLNVIDGLSYSVLMKLLRDKDVKVNGVRVKTDVLVKSGDNVEIYYTIKELETFKIIYKDDNVLVVYKLSGFTSETVFENVKKQFQTAGFIHRLDRNTDGVMVFSLNAKAETELLNGFKNKTFTKIYHAEVVGFLPKSSDTMQAYLVKDSQNSLVKIYDKKVDGAVVIKTAYKTIRKLSDSTLIEVQLFTGKTHQIRAHFAHIGNPIVGDSKYGDNQYNKSKKIKSQVLTAKKLTLNFQENSCLYYLNGKTFSC